MTTNYLGRLDPALVRPGRVDVKEYIGTCARVYEVENADLKHFYRIVASSGWCSPSQVEQMFLRFYKEPGKNPDTLAKTFANSVMSHGKNVSPAQIQGYFMFHKSNPDAVIDNVAQIWELT